MQSIRASNLQETSAHTIIAFSASKTAGKFHGLFMKTCDSVNSGYQDAQKHRNVRETLASILASLDLARYSRDEKYGLVYYERIGWIIMSMSPPEKVLETRCEIGVVTLICGNSMFYPSGSFTWMSQNKSQERPRLEIARHETANVTRHLLL